MSRAALGLARSGRSRDRGVDAKARSGCRRRAAGRLRRRAALARGTSTCRRERVRSADREGGHGVAALDRAERRGVAAAGAAGRAPRSAAAPLRRQASRARAHQRRRGRRERGRRCARAPARSGERRRGVGGLRRGRRGARRVARRSLPGGVARRRSRGTLRARRPDRSGDDADGERRRVGRRGDEGRRAAPRLERRGQDVRIGSASRRRAARSDGSRRRRHRHRAREGVDPRRIQTARRPRPGRGAARGGVGSWPARRGVQRPPPRPLRRRDHCRGAEQARRPRHQPDTRAYQRRRVGAREPRPRMARADLHPGLVLHEPAGQTTGLHARRLERRLRDARRARDGRRVHGRPLPRCAPTRRRSAPRPRLPRRAVRARGREDPERDGPRRREPGPPRARRSALVPDLRRRRAGAARLGAPAARRQRAADRTPPAVLRRGPPRRLRSRGLRDLLEQASRPRVDSVRPARRRARRSGEGGARRLRGLGRRERLGRDDDPLRAWRCVPCRAAEPCTSLAPERLLTARPLPGRRALVARLAPDDAGLELRVEGGAASPQVRVSPIGNVLDIEVTGDGHPRLWTSATLTTLSPPGWLAKSRGYPDVEAFLVGAGGALVPDPDGKAALVREIDALRRSR